MGVTELRQRPEDRIAAIGISSNQEVRDRTPARGPGTHDRLDTVGVEWIIAHSQELLDNAPKAAAMKTAAVMTAALSWRRLIGQRRRRDGGCRLNPSRPGRARTAAGRVRGDTAKAERPGHPDGPRTAAPRAIDEPLEPSILVRAPATAGRRQSAWRGSNSLSAWDRSDSHMARDANGESPPSRHRRIGVADAARKALRRPAGPFRTVRPTPVVCVHP
jgi:hypothetical protein